MNKEDEIFKNFIVEMGERLQDLEDALAELDQGYQPNLINQLFRCVHTIKGGGSFFGLIRIQELSHEFEEILMKIREEELPFDKAMVPAFFSACDALKDMHEADDYGESHDVGEVCRELKTHLKGVGDHGEASSDSATVTPSVSPEAELEPAPVEPETPSPEPSPVSSDEPQDASVTSVVAASSESLSSSAAGAGGGAAEATPARKATTDKKQSQNETIRVKVDLLNKLMELTGEIVLGRNQLLRQLAEVEEKGTMQAMAHMISDLQQLVLQTRMQPIGSAFTKFKRIVRDLSKSLGKEISLIITGEDTELDRSIIESLSDPLTHLIRNCADHGLEMPDERTAQGKDRVGTLRLEARHEGGQVVITVKDDGKGIDAEKVKGKAMASQVVTQAEADAMSDNEAAKLIFHPGLSTAEQITNLSGRGVGMDVVKSTFEKLGGAIDLETKVGEGTSVIIHLPTTLTIMSSLIVRIAGDRFAVPHSELKEVILVRPEDEFQIETIRGREVYRLRGSLIPILNMDEITETEASLERGAEEEEVESGEEFSAGGNAAKERLFLVLHSGVNVFGLLIDSIDHTEEIVVKPLPQLLSKFSCYAGSSILGDSDVAMVLSANGICQSNKLHAHDLESQAESRHSLAETQLIDMQEKQDLLVFKYAEDEQLAIPLSLVFKVEQIDVDEIQAIADNHFINLEGRNVQLLHLDKYLSLKPLPSSLRTYYVIIPKIKDFNVGIVASVIEESVHTRLNLDTPPISQESILGVTTIRERITYLVDLFNLAEQVSPERFKGSRELRNPEKDRLLVVEDTPFFRDLEKKYFESVGFKVTLANNGREALDFLLERPGYFHLIVSDIVMPVMDGYDLIKNVKGSPELRGIPVIALTSFSEEEHREKALAAGFDDYAIKTNKETILHSVHRFLTED